MVSHTHTGTSRTASFISTGGGSRRGGRVKRTSNPFSPCLIQLPVALSCCTWPSEKGTEEVHREQCQTGSANLHKRTLSSLEAVTSVMRIHSIHRCPFTVLPNFFVGSCLDSLQRQRPFYQRVKTSQVLATYYFHKKIFRTAVIFFKWLKAWTK